MTAEEKALPEGWVEAPGHDLFAYVTSGSRGWKKYYSDHGAFFVRIGNLSRQTPELDQRDVQRVTAPDGAEGSRTRVMPADLMISITADLGRLAMAPADLGEAYVNQHVALVRPVEGSLSPLLAWFLLSPAGQSALATHDRGATRAGLGLDDIRGIRIPLPPLAEQRRIVEKIETLTTRSRRAREALESLPALLDRYRASVLAAAFRGDLTKDWRESVAAGSAADFRQRLLSARAQAEKVKPPSPINPELNLPDLPGGWLWVSLDELLTGIKAGKSFRCEERPPTDDEIGLVKISAVTWGTFDEEESKTVLDHTRLDPRDRIGTGDFLISRANTIDLVGACVLVEAVERELYLSDKVLRFDFALDLREWAMWWLRSPFGRFQIKTSSSGNQMSMRNIGQQALRSLAVPLPPEEEIEEIIRRLRLQLRMEAVVRDTLDGQRDRLSTLDQSILAKAFRGDLVPQDPTDEPASALLNRIRARRAAVGPAPMRGRRKTA